MRRPFMSAISPSTPPKSRYTSSFPSTRYCWDAGPRPESVLTACRVGEIKRLVMGLDRYQKTPCGFCFVEYYTHQDALDCMKYIGQTKLDERLIRTDLDEGFEEGRQYGRVSPRLCNRIKLTQAQSRQVWRSGARRVPRRMGSWARWIRKSVRWRVRLSSAFCFESDAQGMSGVPALGALALGLFSIIGRSTSRDQCSDGDLFLPPFYVCSSTACSWVSISDQLGQTVFSLRMLSKLLQATTHECVHRPSTPGGN